MNKINAVIIMLLVANLTATIWFGGNENTSEVQGTNEQVLHHELPPEISEGVRADLFETFTTNFNSANYDALYDMFGPVAKEQLVKEEIYNEFRKLTKFFHQIESGEFGMAEFSGQQGDTKVYVLNYPVKLSEKSEFGKSGVLKITVAANTEGFQVYGIYLHANTNA